MKLSLFTLLIIIISTSPAREWTVRGNSMAPCLKHGDKLEIKHAKTIHRNHLVIFKRKGKLVIKRIVAIEGDSIKLIKKDHCFNIAINNQIQNTLSGKNYCTTRKTLKNFETTSLPKNQFIVLGEVPAGSEDSTLFGPISKRVIIGSRAKFCK